MFADGTVAQCGGTLIDAHRVLSAGHCFLKGREKVEGVKLTLGAHDLASGAWSDRQVELGVPGSSVLIHPNYTSGLLIKIQLKIKISTLL